MRSVIAAWEPFSLWLLFSLLAIAFVGSRPYLALAISVAGGIVMAVTCLAGFSSSRQEEKNGSGK